MTTRAPNTGRSHRNTGEPPCITCECPRYTDCEQQHLACEAFGAFVQRGTHAGRSVWAKLAAPTPTREQFLQIMNAEANDDAADPA